LKQVLIANNITSEQTWDFFCLPIFIMTWLSSTCIFVCHFLSSKLLFCKRFFHQHVISLLPTFLILRPTCFDTLSCLQCLCWIPVLDHILHYFECNIRTEEHKFQMRHCFIWTVPISHLHNLYLRLKFSHERILLGCLTIIYSFRKLIGWWYTLIYIIESNFSMMSFCTWSQYHLYVTELVQREVKW
jgi:hypothetical protein